MHSDSLLSTLVIVWLAAKLASEGLQRLGQTAVLGELLAGVVIGPAALNLVRASDRLDAFAEIGIVILLFEIGLASDLDGLLRSGAQALLVAVVGVLLPLALGFALARAWGLSLIESVFIGSTLTATSVGITARLMADLGRLGDPAAEIVLAAAVVDDVLGLGILAVVTGLARTGSVSAASLTFILIKAMLFLVLAIVLGVRLAPVLIRWVGHMQTRGSLIVFAVFFCTLLAVLAERVGLAALVGAFAAGLILAKTERGAHIEQSIKPVADLFVPIFFVTVGVRVDPSQLQSAAPRGALAFAALLTVMAVVAKLAVGFVVYQRGVRRWCVGVGMIPRGEVGLVFAGVGIATGIITADLYAAVVVMILLTTFVAPLWLRALYRR